MIAAPPRQQPASIRSPGTPSASTVSTHRRRLRRRSTPTIVCAYTGQAGKAAAPGPRLRVIGPGPSLGPGPRPPGPPQPPGKAQALELLGEGIPHVLRRITGVGGVVEGVGEGALQELEIQIPQLG